GFFGTEKQQKGLFEHVAFVSVLTGTKVRAQIPVALVDDRTVVIPVTLGNDANLQLVVRRELWVRQVYESLLVLADQFKELEGMVGKSDQREEALRKGRTQLTSLQDDVTRFAKQREELAK